MLIRRLRLSLLFLLVACASSPQTPKAPRLSGFGDATVRRIATASPQAQTWFNQGLQQNYAFDHIEAQRDFRAALAADPGCAMCAWGLAWSLGPNFNRPQRAELGEARRMAALAAQLASPGLERELAEALVARYGSTDGDLPAAELATVLAQVDRCGGDRDAVSHPLDRLYAARMQALAEARPEDPDLQALHAEAQFIAYPGDAYSKETQRTAARWVALTERLLASAKRHPQHTGVLHYLTHAGDTPDLAERTLAVGASLATVAPAAPHLQHMPSHLQVRLGRYQEAREANQRGLQAQVALRAEWRRQGVTEATDWDLHNRRFLWFVAVQLGDADAALREAQELVQAIGDRPGDGNNFSRGMPLLTLALFERWEAILRATETESGLPMAAGLRAHARGLALLKLGRPAAAEMQTLEQELAKAKARGVKPAIAVATSLLAPLQAEQAWRRNQPEQAVTALREALRVEADLPGGEPPILASNAQRALGWALLRSGDPGAAEAAFQADLRGFPGNALGQRGLAAARLARRI